ncbi:MAG: hypothetical protein GTO63_12030 [Anaerolineae bacterium]|nr:hypothetical protein [Anaerolineae bacterium]NIN95624.1 hypothetical protein [Anaerolineae bacterium]NIQ78582.1 hypothetical protein [Anaerolineae bacterium]
MAEIADRVWAKLKPLYDELKFDPLPKQKQVLCNQGDRTMMVGGVGAGKSLTAAMYAVPRVMLPSTDPYQELAHYWLVGQTYEVPRMEFNYIVKHLEKLEIPMEGLSRPKDGRYEVTIPGVSKIETKSWTKKEGLRSIPVQGMLVCEAGLLPYDVWHMHLRDRLERVADSWCFWCGTIEDAGVFYKEMVRDVVIEQSLDGWFGVSMATWENTHKYPKGIEDPRIQRLRDETPEDIFQERYAAIPRAVAALVYREFAHKWHVYLEPKWWDKHRPVYLFVDPAGVYALNAVQMRGENIDVIDEIHGEHWTTEDAIREAVSREWWPKVSFVLVDKHTYEEAWLNWAGRALIWKVLDEEPKPVRSKHVGISDGIELVRSKLHSGAFEEDELDRVWHFQGKPGVARLRIAAQCEHTIYEFAQGYKRKKLRSGMYSPDEVVKADNHHCSAIAYGLAELFGLARRKARAKKVYVPYVDSRPTVVH